MPPGGTRTETRQVNGPGKELQFLLDLALDKSLEGRRALTATTGDLFTQPANILDIRHDRSSWRVPLGDVQVQLLLETRQAAHGEEICAALRARGMDASLEPAPSSPQDEKPAT